MTSLVGIDTDARATRPHEGDARTFEGKTQLCLRRPMDRMTTAFKVTDRAAGHPRMLGQIRLSPVEITARRPTQRG